MNDTTILGVTAIAGLTVLESVNLYVRGPDGAIFGTVVAAIAGLGGFILGRTV